MKARDGWETNETMLAAARAAGFSPSEKQRKDWRRAGLLPRPVDPHGSGRGRGTAFYPPGTGELLIAICRHSQSKKQRGDVAFLVWWEGFPVDPQIIRAGLTSYLKPWEALLEQWRSLPAEARHDRLGRDPTGRLPEPLASMRRAVGPRAFVDTLSVLTRIADGTFRDWAYSGQMETFIESVGLHRAMTDRIGEVKPWLNPSLRQPLRELTASLQPAHLRDALNRAADDELNQARDELQAFFGVLYTGRRTVESMFGSGAFGLGLLPGPSDLNHKTAPGLLLCWLAWRRLPMFAEGYAALMTFAMQGAPLDFFASLMRTGETRERQRALVRAESAAPGEEPATCPPR